MRSLTRRLFVATLGLLLLRCGEGTLTPSGGRDSAPAGNQPQTEDPGSSPDTTAPSFAGATAAVANGANITVTWAGATDDHDTLGAIAYRVYMAEVSGGQLYAVPTAITAPGATSYTATGLIDGDTYYFVVHAVDAAGNEETNRAEVSALVTDGLSPFPDAELRVTPVYADTEASAGTLEVSWDAWKKDPRIDPLIGYQLCWSADRNGCSPFNAMRSTPPMASRRTTLTGLMSATRYSVFLRPVDGANTVVGRVTQVAGNTATSFQKQILQGILQAPRTSGGCVASGCHEGDGWTYAELVNVNASNSACSLKVRVVPGDPMNSLVYRKMTAEPALPANCGQRMPLGGPVSAGSVVWMFDWIKQGAKRN